MADIPDPSVLDQTTVAAEGTKTAIDSVTVASESAAAALGKLYTTADSAADSFNDFITAYSALGKLTPQQANQFNLLSTAILGVRRAFNDVSLAGGGFVNQLLFITNGFKNSTGAIGALANISANVFGKVMPNSVKTSVGAAKEFVLNLAMSADNALRLQTRFLALSAASGNLGKVYQAAGKDLGNINELLLRQRTYIDLAADSTGLTANEVEKYYEQLGKIPGALESTISGTHKSGMQMNMLTAAIKLAHGSGRDFSDIVNDLSVAFKDYGLTGEKALTFSARMGDVANSLGLNLKDVQSHLMGAADAFARFADAGDKSLKMSEGLARITNEYVNALKLTGMSGTHALGVVKGMTNAIANMSLAQKAFLSGQTGGPGGLMGAFQIEKMMRDSDVEGVLKKMRDQMRQQFGKIVTLDEAASNQAAAAQMTRQIAILKSGPLGKLVQTDQDAYRMLESFEKIDSGGLGGVGLTADVLKEGMDKGTDIQQGMATDIAVMRSLMEKQQGVADVSGLGLMKGVAKTSGAAAFMKGSAEAGGDKTKMYAAGIEAHTMSDTMSQEIVYNINNLKKLVGSVPTNLSKAFDKLKISLLNPSDYKAIESANAELEKSIKEQQAKLKSAPKSQQDAIKKQIAAEQAVHDQVMSGLYSKPDFAGGIGKVLFTPGAILEESTAAKTAKTKPGAVSAGPITVPGGQPFSGTIEVKVTGYCLHCGNILDDPQAKAILPIKK